jgi:FlaA1/EpsC-like NDP-sugar epimerase
MASHRYRRVLIFLIQLGLVVASYTVSFVLSLDLEPSRVPADVILETLPLLIFVRMASLALFSLYRGLWRYVSVVDMVQIIKATTISSLLFVALEIPIFGLEEFPRSVFIIDWAGNIFLLTGIRLVVRIGRERFRPMLDGTDSSKRILIIGAGDAGAALCRQARRNPSYGFRPVAFVDDDPSKAGMTIHGVPVAGRSKDISRVVEEYRADSAVITIPSATSSQMRALVENCQRAQVPFKVLPAISAILDGTVSISRIRDVDPVDLLGRPPARLDRAVIQESIHGKRILITGAGGSVGSELTRQIAGLEPELLVLVDHAENSLFFLEAEIRSLFPDMALVARIADVTDEGSIAKLMQEHRPQTVFHAAAHKHVSLMEDTPAEAVRNNVGGTYAVARCAQNAGAQVFLMVSTDKAVSPTSVMGASKRLAELLVQEMNGQGSTRFVSVRFGNVLGSNASVVPIFKQQIASGGPVTVTHRDVERYFMSIYEAAGLILQAAAVGTGREIFVLDMGEPVRIVTLAETMISLSGLKPHDDIDIVFTGLRPGEKLSEDLRFEGESLQPTEYEKLLVVKGGQAVGVLPKVGAFLLALPALGPEEVKAHLKRLVPEYQPSDPR